MKHPLTLVCVLTLSAFSVNAMAGEIPAPPKKPLLEPVSAETGAPASTKKKDKKLEISRKDDLMLSCAQLREEVASMRGIIAEKQDVKDTSAIQSKGISAAGAVGSFLVGTVTGGIGLAAAGLMLDHNISENKDKADEAQDIAEQRRTWLKGLYTAQACEGDIETPEQEEQMREVQTRRGTIEEIARIDTASGGDKEPGKPAPYQDELNNHYND